MHSIYPNDSMAIILAHWCIHFLLIINPADRLEKYSA